MGVDFWNAVFQWGSVVLVAFTFILGAGALWTGNTINQRQTERLVALEADLAAAQKGLAAQQERAAVAELELTRLRARQEPRRIDAQRFLAALAGNPKAAVSIWYQPDDGEAFQFATDIYLRLATAKWKAFMPEPIPSWATTADLANAGRALGLIPLAMRAGGQPLGVTLVARSLNATPASFNTLKAALLASVSSVGEGVDAALPEEEFRIVVGQKP